MNILELARKRYSVRNYSPRAIEKEKLDYVLECARIAPSACNRQPWKFTVVQTDELRKEVCSCYHGTWVATAPAVIVVSVDAGEAWTRPADGKNHADIDAAIAIEHICLAAAEQDLGTCWVCNFDAQKCAEVMQLPADNHVVALVPIGYPATERTAPAKRKSTEEVVSRR